MGRLLAVSHRLHALRAALIVLPGSALRSTDWWPANSGGGAAFDGIRGQGGLPLIRRRYIRPALALPRRVWRQQGSARETRGGVARRTSGYQLHVPDRRGVRRRRGRRANGNDHRLGSRTRCEGLPALGVAWLHAGQADARRGPRRSGAHDPADRCGHVDAARDSQGCAG